jgi:hypothetical protein
MKLKKQMDWRYDPSGRALGREGKAREGSRKERKRREGGGKGKGGGGKGKEKGKGREGNRTERNGM